MKAFRSEKVHVVEEKRRQSPQKQMAVLLMCVKLFVKHPVYLNQVGGSTRDLLTQYIVTPSRFFKLILQHVFALVLNPQTRATWERMGYDELVHLPYRDVTLWALLSLPPLHRRFSNHIINM